MPLSNFNFAAAWALAPHENPSQHGQDINSAAPAHSARRHKWQSLKMNSQASAATIFAALASCHKSDTECYLVARNSHCALCCMPQKKNMEKNGGKVRQLVIRNCKELLRNYQIEKVSENGREREERSAEYF